MLYNLTHLEFLLGHALYSHFSALLPDERRQTMIVVGCFPEFRSTLRRKAPRLEEKWFETLIDPQELHFGPCPWGMSLLFYQWL